ncbi:major facilitator superfamily transporter [Colletotrichum tamarilloi]|uniref:Major facilitator superfamily transporter n=1 Tax=Colletotrichum tamarilloi TaxID=1209934 RepID=A0ABQ9QNU3_9PEZI|nr:major facilitator superfamily transporter [Colletotrichum tamarilloi]KAK1479730.1 major facilitator superfamily transporter [Colletotrichum tamarilloi]
MLEKRNSVERSRGDTDASNKDMGSTPAGAGAGATAGPGEAVAAAAAEEKEASVPQEVIRNSAANSVRDGGFGGDDDEKRVSTGGGNETRSPSPSPSNSDCESHRDGGKKDSRKGVIGATVGFLTWTPRKLRYDPENPPQFTLGLNFLFAVAATFTVANLYYNQPVLNRIAETFNVSFERASSVATLMPHLGDSDAGLSFIVGATTVTPQLMLPLVADMAPPERKASSLSITTSGLMLGMLIARLLSGIVANYTSWRNIYWFSFGAQNLLLVLLFFFVPDYPSTNPDGLNYFRALWTIVTMLFTEPILVQACLIGFFISSIFTSFWTTLTFLLASPPYEYPSITIGLFSLIGIAAICGGPVYGRLIMDRYVPWLSSVLGQTVILIGCIIGAFTGTFTVAGPVIQAICIDMGIQTAQTANRTAIYTINPKARNRVNTAYMVCVFCGQLTVGFIGLSLIITMLKGPREKSWIGWRGGFKLRKDAPKHQPASPEESQGPVQEPVEKRTDIGAGGEGNRR